MACLSFFESTGQIGRVCDRPVGTGPTTEFSAAQTGRVEISLTLPARCFAYRSNSKLEFWKIEST